MADSSSFPQALGAEVGVIAPLAAEPEALRAPTHTVSLGFTLMICLANVALWISMQPVAQLLLPQQAELLGGKAHEADYLGIILGVGAFVSIFSNVLGGAFSDRTTSRFGRRRPWLVVCALLTAATLALLANAPAIYVLVIGWGLYQLFANGVLAALVAIVPDRVPERQRGSVSAFVGLALPLAQVVGAILVGIIVTDIHAGYYLLIGLLLVITMLFAATLHDAPLPKAYVTPFQLWSFIKSFWINPSKYPDFGWVWITRFLVIFGYSAGTSFLLFYLQQAVGLGKKASAAGPPALTGLVLVQIVAVSLLVLSSIVGGILSDRLQRRKAFVMFSTALIAVALLSLGFFVAWPYVLVAAGVLGFGFGSYLAVDIALVTQVLPSAHDRGKDMGIFNIANALPQAFAPIAAATFLDHFHHNYAAVFIFAAVVTLLGALLVQPIKGVR